MSVTIRHRVTGAEMRVDDSQVDFWAERGYRSGDSSAKKPAAKAPAKKASAKAKK